MVNTRKYDYVIVGSGAGGATLARELSRKGNAVAVIEQGVLQEKLGHFLNCMKYYDLGSIKMGHLSREKTALIWRAFMSGGCTVVSCGNGVRSLEAELAELGIYLEDEFREAEEDMAITPYETSRLSSGGKSILEAATELGYTMESMPKFIDPKKCRRCGCCQYGCQYGAKWTASKFLDDAEEHGTEVLYSRTVDKVIIENGTAKGIVTTEQTGSTRIDADTVVLAAGGIGTPIILQNSGFKKAGSRLFMDMFINTYGVAKGLDQTREPTMALVDMEFHKEEGFILSPFIQPIKMVRFLEAGVRGFMMPTVGHIGLMAKTTDDSVGRIYPDGSFSKTITTEDRKRLDRGHAISKEILVKAGADQKSIIAGKVGGAHPGGTAAIGELVDNNLQTEVNNLFVCDASVLPTAPGMPPILTIVALAKRLAKTLAG